MARRIAAVLVTLGCLQASAVSALGLGELTLESFLNEPFKAQVDLLNTGGISDHQIRIRLATAEDFDRLGVERAYFLTSIKFEVKIDEEGKGLIMMSSEAPVLEPYLDFIVEARWPSGRLLREYTVLVDPPVFDTDKTIIISADETISKSEGSSTAKKKSRTAASSGTGVKVARSDLAEGDMPQRGYGSDASTTPEAGSRYMIRRDETLWNIALNAKPEGVSVHQTMLDIQRMNPKAFIGGNINRIKAGYIIYLPDSNDISSGDLSTALEEVRKQNQDWRDDISTGRDTYSGGASLRISTEPGEDVASTGGSTADLQSLESLERSERDRAEVETRLQAMTEQLNTLQRIVSLKDDQIAALQNALAEANVEAPQAVVEEPVIDESPAIIEDVEVEQEEPEVATVAQPSSPSEEPSILEAEPELATQEPEQEPKDEGGFFGNIVYLIGLLIAAGIAVFFFMRRRGEQVEEEEPVTDDVYADIQIEEENLEVDDVPASGEPTRDEPVREDAVQGKQGTGPERGYGERKHDQYAADMDTGDALAEADIYIAYGRYPQAVELLKTAVAGDPGNASYKLKLMEVSAELGDQAEVMNQLADIKALGDSDSLSRAEDIAQDLEGDGDVQAEPAMTPEAPLEPPEAAGELSLDEDFGGLQIESFDDESIEDDLDLSADFSDDTSDEKDIGTEEGTEAGALDVDGEEEEMVFAADSDTVSTKLDLARAYLDMGDQDGARQIFEEVVAEGSEEQKEEARALIEGLD